jgi:hypothetical protein
MRGTSDQVVYELTVGEMYPVVGMILWKLVLSGLTRSDLGVPVCVPMGVFAPSSVCDPVGWRCSFGGGLRLSGPASWEQPVAFLHGYRELIEDSDHLDDLLSGDPNALATFEKLVGLPAEPKMTSELEFQNAIVLALVQAFVGAIRPEVVAISAATSFGEETLDLFVLVTEISDDLKETIDEVESDLDALLSGAVRVVSHLSVGANWSTSDWEGNGQRRIFARSVEP